MRITPPSSSQPYPAAPTEGTAALKKSGREKLAEASRTSGMALAKELGHQTKNLFTKKLFDLKFRRQQPAAPSSTPPTLAEASPPQANLTPAPRLEDFGDGMPWGHEASTSQLGWGALFEESHANDLEKLATETAAAKTIQRAWRNHQVRQENRKLNQNGLHEIRHPRTYRVVGFIEPKANRPEAGKRSTLAIWPLPQDPRSPTAPVLAGGFKQLTHADTNPDYIKKYGGHVGLTAFRRSSDPFHNFKLSDAARQKIIELNLSHVVIQREVSPGFYIARRMEEDLWERKKRQPLPISGFKSVLENLKTLHENGLAHRDIKPENLLIRDDEAYLSDLDTMDFANRYEPKAFVPGTSRYQDERLSRYLKNLNATSPSDCAAEQGRYAKVMDSYAMLITLIESQANIDLKTRKKDENGHGYSVFQSTANQAVSDWTSRYVKPEYLKDVYEILMDPASYSEKHHHQPPHLYDMLQFDADKVPAGS